MDVQAVEITETVFKYTCNCKRGFHSHGSAGDVSNRVEERVSHCPQCPGELRIHITDATIRKLKSKQQ